MKPERFRIFLCITGIEVFGYSGDPIFLYIKIDLFLQFDDVYRIVVIEVILLIVNRKGNIIAVGFRKVLITDAYQIECFGNSLSLLR